MTASATYSNLGAPLQVVDNITLFNTSTYLLASTNRGYQEIPNTSKTFQVKAAGSTLLIQAYVNGYSSDANGSNMAIQVNGVNYWGDDSWSRAHNGWTGSFNIGRILTIPHGLQAGGSCTIKLFGGVWTSGSTYFGYPGYSTYMGWTAIELGA